MALLFAAALVLLLAACQHKIIYFPRAYPPGALQQFGMRAAALDFKTSQGIQRAYYVPPRSGAAPRTLWVLFGGNAFLALDWRFLVNGFPDADAAFLLIDYPGYGACEGRAGSKNIMESADAALAAMARISCLFTLLISVKARYAATTRVNETRKENRKGTKYVKLKPFHK